MPDDKIRARYIAVYSSSINALHAAFDAVRRDDLAASSSINALHAAFDAVRRDDLADAEFQFDLVANALANTIGKEVTP